MYLMSMIINSFIRIHEVCRKKNEYSPKLSWKISTGSPNVYFLPLINPSNDEFICLVRSAGDI